MELSVPWRSLSSKPVVMQLNDVFLVARSPHHDPNAVDPDKAREAANDTKLSGLLGAERRADLKREAGAGDREVAVTLVSKIVDNLQVEARRIHIRYEDDLSWPGHPFSAGIFLEEISARSCNASWEVDFVAGESVMRKVRRPPARPALPAAAPAFVSPRLSQSPQLVALNRLGAYLTPDDTSVGASDLGLLARVFDDHRGGQRARRVHLAGPEVTPTPTPTPTITPTILQPSPTITSSSSPSPPKHVPPSPKATSRNPRSTSPCAWSRWTSGWARSSTGLPSAASTSSPRGSAWPTSASTGPGMRGRPRRLPGGGSTRWTASCTRVAQRRRRRSGECGKWWGVRAWWRWANRTS